MNQGKQSDIVQAAKDEYQAWIVRNQTKKEVRQFRSDYTNITGEWWNYDEEFFDNADEDGYCARYDDIMARHKAAKKDLTLKRNRTRRLIKKELENGIK